MRVISIRHEPEYKEHAVEYIYEKWGDGNRQLYVDSIFGCIGSRNPIPHWYLLEDGNRIVGCAGLVEHDFIDRVDLSPWLCALYIEKDKRGKSLSKLLIDQVKRDARHTGFEKVYLCTEHVGFYEKFGFQYIGEGKYPDGDPSRIYEAEIEAQLEIS